MRLREIRRYERQARELAKAAADVAGLEENWRVIRDGAYEVSDLGRVRRVATSKGTYAGKPVKSYVLSKGYRYIQIDRVTFTVHALVCAAFIGVRPIGHVVNHKNGDKADNRLSNLEYVTYKENSQHAVDTGLSPVGDARWNTKYSDEQIIDIRARHANGERPRVLSAVLGIPVKAVYQLVSVSSQRCR